MSKKLNPWLIAGGVALAVVVFKPELLQQLTGQVPPTTPPATP